ncbi:complement factor B-like [Engystomops pustulosus]|uniref:complement factor B-like n=1 Tax=Engystomops pustulosus TaxID=76066 RepID=UPI003AFA82DC
MFPLLLLVHIAGSIAAPAPKCALDNIDIKGGEYRVVDVENFMRVVYKCPEGLYPHPSYSRDCLYNGKWSNDKVKAECRAVECPRPVMFDNGVYYPRQKKYFIGDVLHFECWEGLEMFGPGNRTCQPNGKWSGEVTKCDGKDGDCPNPGVPIGSTKVGTSYMIEGTVKYECQSGLRMFGSKERTCMENKRWSGAEPSCRFPFTFDTPKEVAEIFSSSLSETIEASDPDKLDEQSDRKIQVRKDGLMNIFIIIDSSKSVGVENFKTAKAASIVFIDKMASFDFTPRYGVISYASFAKPIVRLSDDDSTDAEAVIERIRKFNYREHDDKMGTNTRGALIEVHGMLSLQNTNEPQKFLETRNVILLMTDGKHNMGGDPVVEMKKIRELLDIRKNNNREDFLDVYVFGLGEDISENEINDIASKKNPEKHVFKMKSVDHMKEAFDEMLDEAEVLQMCGLSKDPSKGEEGVQEVYPWIAKITITRPGSEDKCKGSIVSRFFILTAAHCLHLDDSPQNVNVRVGDTALKVKNLHRHSKYNPAGKQDKKVEKSFDYDLALIELQSKIEYSRKVRPICLPCTSATTWALKKRGQAVTCNDHKNTVLDSELVKAMFVAEETRYKFERMNVTIKRGDKRNACLEDTKKIEKFKDIPDITDAITENFLCTGGVQPYVDPQTCKGDSGGPLIVQYKQRYVQVGVISWGTINSCIGPKRKPEPVPALSRDFHTDLFHMLDWLEGIKLLAEELQFLK